MKGSNQNRKIYSLIENLPAVIEVKIWDKQSTNADKKVMNLYRHEIFTFVLVLLYVLYSDIKTVPTRLTR